MIVLITVLPSRLAPLDLGRFRNDESRASRGKSEFNFSGVMTCSKNMFTELCEFVLDDFLDSFDGRLLLRKLDASCASSFAAANDTRLTDVTDGRDDSCVVVELSFSSQITSKFEPPVTYLVEQRRDVGFSMSGLGMAKLDSTNASVHTVAAGKVDAGCAPSLLMDADLVIVERPGEFPLVCSPVVDVSNRENVETIYDSKFDFSLLNLGSGKNVNSILCGLLFVVARRSVLMAGLSGSLLKVACLTVERSGVKTRVDADFEGRVQRLDRFSASSVEARNVLPTMVLGCIDNDLLLPKSSASNSAGMLADASMLTLPTID